MADTEVQEKDEISVYEVAFHIDANLSETETQKTFNSVKEAIVAAGGTPFAEALPVRMNLAYTISQINEGVRRDHTSSHFAWVAYELAPEKQSEIDEVLREDKTIVRHLVTITTKEEAEYVQNRAAEKLIVAKPEGEGLSDKELDEAIEKTTA
ncbi:30S ribosomal protein S6 [Candidatus Wolfebacteria bacterium]|nr:30S ribosomal protein S6 [Candidatus Wolfebacteria bacterium]